MKGSGQEHIDALRRRGGSLLPGLVLVRVAEWIDQIRERVRAADTQWPRVEDAPPAETLKKLPPLPWETRMVDPDTGGAKGKKLERYDLLPAGPLAHVARHYGVGAAKYDDRNWELGYAWSLSFAAMQRHLWAFWGGEDLDAETGSPHLAAAVFHCFALMEYATTHPEKDDRVR